MHRDPRAFLWDVTDAAAAIQAFTQGMDREHFRQNALVQAAVERKFEVIGEALNQLSKIDQDLAARIPDLAQIVAFRNQLIHGYASISVDTIWSVIEFSLHPLSAVTQALLAELGPL